MEAMKRIQKVRILTNFVLCGKRQLMYLAAMKNQAVL